MRAIMRTSAVLLAALLCCGDWSAAGGAPVVARPLGDIVERNLDRAAENAIRGWIGKLQDAPNLENVKNIGIIRLDNDARDFTELLSALLSADRRFQVTILSGGEWDAIEDELARTDPDSGYGDIMAKASIIWQAQRDAYVIPETAQGADALLIGRVRGVDTDWLRARVRLALHLARIDTRTQAGGGIAEGESVTAWKDLLIYYKIPAAIAAAGLIALIVILMLLHSLVKRATRPR